MNYFHFRQAKLHYLKTGSGPKTVFTFHGFAQTAGVFNQLSEHLKVDYTFYHFDVFFHGESTWSGISDPIDLTVWKELIAEFLSQESITRISLIGFSIGARLALATLMSHPARINSLVLIAPDGINRNFWYLLATYPWFIRVYFRRLITRPLSFFYLLNMLLKLKLVHKSVIRLAETQMINRRSRYRVYHCWQVLRKLQFRRRGIIKLINIHQINFSMVLGKKDKIIRPKRLSSLSFQTNGKFFLLETNHWKLLQEAIKLLNEEHKSMLPMLLTLLHFFYF